MDQKHEIAIKFNNFREEESIMASQEASSELQIRLVERDMMADETMEEANVMYLDKGEDGKIFWDPSMAELDLMIQFKLVKGEASVGSISFPLASLFLPGDSFRQWFTIFDTFDDDEFDGDIGVSDDELPMINVGFQIREPDEDEDEDEDGQVEEQGGQRKEIPSGEEAREASTPQKGEEPEDSEEFTMHSSAQIYDKELEERDLDLQSEKNVPTLNETIKQREFSHSPSVDQLKLIGTSNSLLTNAQLGNNQPEQSIEELNLVEKGSPFRNSPEKVSFNTELSAVIKEPDLRNQSQFDSVYHHLKQSIPENQDVSPSKPLFEPGIAVFKKKVENTVIDGRDEESPRPQRPSQRSSSPQEMEQERQYQLPAKQTTAKKPQEVSPRSFRHSPARSQNQEVILLQQISELQKSNRQLSETMEKQITGQKSLKKEISQLKAKNSRLTQEKDELKQDLNSCQLESSEAQIEADSLRSQLERAQARVQSLESVQQGNDSQMSSIRKEVSSLKDINGKLRTKIQSLADELEEEMSNLTASNLEKDENLLQLRTQNAEFRKDYNAQRVSTQEVEEKLQIYKEEAQTRASELRMSHQAVRNLKIKVKDLEFQLLGITEVDHDALKDVQGTSVQNTLLQQIKTLNSSLNKKEYQLEQKDQRLKVLQEEVQNARKMRPSLKRNKSHNSGLVSPSKDSIGSVLSPQKARHLQKRVSALEEERESYRQDTIRLRIELEEAQDPSSKLRASKKFNKTSKGMTESVRLKKKTLGGPGGLGDGRRRGRGKRKKANKLESSPKAGNANKVLDHKIGEYFAQNYPDHSIEKISNGTLSS